MRRWILSGVLLLALVVTGIWGYNQFLQNQDHTIRANNLYQKSFYELVGRVDNIESGLSKMMVTGDKGQSIVMLSDVWRQADSASSDLGQLPLRHMALDKTSKFLGQLSDYCRYLTIKAGQGRPLSIKDGDNLKELHNSSIKLSNELKVLESDVNAGTVSWQKIMAYGNKSLEDVEKDIVTKQFTKIEETSIEYPTLIYDGPFSETLLRGKQLNLPGSNISYSEAERIARGFIGNKRINRAQKGAETMGDIETWGVTVETKDSEGPYHLSITKKGGKIISVVSEGVVEKPTMSYKESVGRAKEFLDKNGFKNMVSTYGQFNDGVAVINFAYEEGDTIIYPDLIKVKISLATGNLMGFEALNYLTAHRERHLESPKLSIEEARKLVNKNLEITSERLAVIPSKGGNEIQCYEFKGKFGGEDFIVYINSDTGTEEDILKILNTENGTMVI
ncbi:MAG: germination protein YpeB [Clostridiales bacterium]|nr:germination protein YpeB [Clostridiales bacterium]